MGEAIIVARLIGRRRKLQYDAAVGNALQAFEDGLYLVVIDGQQR
ncbi:MAG TPA: hypothetical protein P5279_16930 [Anaerohalosphaeraceae bacterium]|jgi:hypothetical protein|nr:hypothetical protein [Anaerohalosphaeraceae bacterium]HRT52175.1 hypothetical protein [Anaerohalosphaeraceae bacterium]HRT88207.1 hypothetical protein [Anaerohalosphaeraceae bacterium]